MTRLISFHPHFASTCRRVVLSLCSATAVLLMGVALGAAVHAQAGAGDWIWMGGSNTGGTGGQSGVYGTLGTPAAGNIPGGRFDAVSWTDSSGNFWLFGGDGYDGAGNNGGLNDLWEFNPSTNRWTW